MPFCPSCGSAVETGSLFCPACGSSLGGAGPGPAPTKQAGGVGEGAVSPWAEILDPGEKVMFQCSGAKMWAKESYGSIVGRSAARSMAKSAAHANWASGGGSNADYRASLQKADRQYAAPRLPGAEGESLLVTDRRLMLTSGQGVTFELAIDAEMAKRDLEELTKTNQEAVNTYKEKGSGLWNQGVMKGILKAYTPSASKDLGPQQYGAQFSYAVLLSAEAKGRMLGGRELELKLGVIDLAKKIEGASFMKKHQWGREAAVMKSGVRSYGLKFREEDKVDEIAGFLQGKVPPMQQVVKAYE